MDPLSIVASAIAVVQVADRVTGLLAKLKPLLDAPKAVEQLIKDVAIFRILVDDLQLVGGELLTLVAFPAERLELLNGMIADGSLVVIELERLIEEEFKRLSSPSSTSSLKVRRLSWTRQVGKVEKLRQRMMDIRLSLAVQLGSLNLLATAQSRKPLNDVLMLASQLLSEDTNTRQFILGRFAEHESLLTRLIDVSKMGQPEPSEMDTENPSSSALMMQSQVPLHPGSTLNAVRRRMEKRYTCNRRCNCECHGARRVNLPVGSTSTDAVITIEVIGKPFLRHTCVDMSCKQRSEFRLQVRVNFPRWIIARIMTISIWSSSSMPIKCALRYPRVREYGSPIFQFALAGNLPAIRQLLASGQASVFDVDPAYQSALAMALDSRMYETIEFLVKAGADLESKDCGNYSSFDRAWKIIATRSRINRAGVERLRQIFPDPGTYFQDWGMSTLQLIIIGQHDGNIQEEIVSPGTDINHKDHFNNSALSWAIECGKSDIVSQLLLHGADPLQVDLYGQTMLHYASVVDYLSIPKLIAAGVDPNAHDLNGCSALLYTSVQKHKYPELFMEPLLNAGADIETTNCNGRTPLGIAVSQDENIEVVRFLIQRGAKLEISNADAGVQPLITAISYQQAEYVDILIEAGADCGIVFGCGCGIMHFAGWCANIATLKVLSKWRRKLSTLDLRQKNEWGRTALDLAEERDDVSPEWAEAFAKLVDGILDIQDERLEQERVSDVEDVGYETDNDDYEDALEVQE